ncbi:MAG: hypothetical protein IPJ30_14880 [Acidobacteria bacterium]|nr:hypothetical protein [Acidobacteriota bacterium]
MESKELKSEFGKLAKKNGFATAFGGWFRESAECFTVLELFKSKYSNKFLLLRGIRCEQRGRVSASGPRDH